MLKIFSKYPDNGLLSFKPSCLTTVMIQAKFKNINVRRISFTQAFTAAPLKNRSISPNPKIDWKSWFKWGSGIAGVLVLGWLVWKEKQDGLKAKDTIGEIDPLLKVEETDSKDVQEVKEFVQTFNASFENSPERETLLHQAFDKINHFRYLGKLSPRLPLTPMLSFAKKGLLILTLCEDPAVRRQAFKYLKILLKQGIDPEEPIKELIFLEKHLGKRLERLSEVNHPIPTLEETVSCYGLLLERIFFFCLLPGAQIDKQDKLDIANRAATVSEKLQKNPAFQYEALNAKALSDHLQTPFQPLTETIIALYEIEEIYWKVKGDVDNLVLECLTTKKGLEKLKDFLLYKNPDNFNKVRQAFLRLEAAWKDIEQSTTELESILLLRPSWHSEVNTITDLSPLKEVIEKTSSWEPLYRATEILSEILFSPRQEDLKEEAFNLLVKLIAPTTPWQVRYKVVTTLVLLKRASLFQDLAEDGLQKHLSVPILDPQSLRALRWFEAVEKSQAEADQKIKTLTDFKPTGKLEKQISSSWVMQRGLFVPRDEVLEDISKQFQSGPVQIIYGSRGTGKTTLAACYSSKYGNDYTKVYWVHGKTLMEDLLDLANLMKISKALTPPERLDLLKKRLESKENAGWLFVIDNVEPDHCDDIKKHIPIEGGHLLLTTYRLPQIEACFSSPKILKVKDFSPLEAAYFLTQKKTLLPTEKKAAQKTAKALGYLPLALVQTRAFLERTNCSFEEFFKLYQESKAKIFTAKEAHPQGVHVEEDGKDENLSIMTLWDMSYAEARKGSPLVEELMGFLSCLSHDDVPLWLIESWAKEFHPDLNQLNLTHITTTLTDYALIERRGEFFKMHSLLQEVAWDHLIAKQAKNLTNALQLLSKLTKLDIAIPNNWETATFLVPHFEAVIEKIRTNQASLLIADIHRWIGLYYSTVQFDYGKARRNLELALAVQRNLLKTDDHPSVAASLNNLAVVLKAQGDLVGAKEMFSQALAIRKRICKTDDHSDVADSLNSLAMILEAQRDLVGAKEMFSQALTIRRKIYKTDDHPSVAASLNNLAVVLKAQGDLVGAKEMFSQALAIKKRIYKTDNHPSVATSLNNLAGILESQGNLEGAREMYSQALDIRKKIYQTDDNPSVATSLNNLAGVLRVQGNLAGAKEMCSRALDIRRKIYQTDNHPDVADSLNNLGEVLQAQGDLVEAKELYSQALEIRRKIYKTDDHPSVATALNNFAGVLLAQGALAEAKELCSQALGIQRKIYQTDDHSEVADSLNNLGEVLQAQGDLVGAKEMFAHALTIQRKIYQTDNHLNVAASLNNLANLLKVQGHLDGAVELYLQVLAIQRKIYQTDIHPDVATSFHNLGEALKKERAYLYAQEMFFQAQLIRGKLYQDNHPDVVASLENYKEVTEALAIINAGINRD